MVTDESVCGLFRLRRPAAEGAKGSLGGGGAIEGGREVEGILTSVGGLSLVDGEALVSRPRSSFSSSFFIFLSFSFSIASPCVSQ